ncbi:MAG: hypothetical protein ACI9P5_003625, partial [Saprospiraceae bacterium]
HLISRVFALSSKPSYNIKCYGGRLLRLWF